MKIKLLWIDNRFAMVWIGEPKKQPRTFKELEYVNDESTVEVEEELFKTMKSGKAVLIWDETGYETGDKNYLPCPKAVNLNDEALFVAPKGDLAEGTEIFCDVKFNDWNEI